jgi:addiction module HigA family antidote
MTEPTRIHTHPGEILLEEFLKPHGLSANALARAIRVPPNRITAIIAAKNPRAVTPDTALRLARLFGTTPQFWINLQSNYDLSVAIAEHGEEIEQDVRPIAA